MKTTINTSESDTICNSWAWIGSEEIGYEPEDQAIKYNLKKKSEHSFRVLRV